MNVLNHVTHSSGMIITSVLLSLSIFKSFHRVSPDVEVGLESILLSPGNPVIYCSFQEFKGLGFALVSDDSLQFHQLFLIKGDSGFLYL